ncbi:DUF86 domain-containing protein [Clostridia bacterium]|nr:DUF86 domain-containing protein [Clostridia bacterium]
MSHPKEYLENILRFIKECEEEQSRLGSKDFYTERAIFKAIALDLIQIGENVAKINKKTPELFEKEPKIPWKQIIGLRNITVHDYDGLDEEEVLETAKTELAPLKKAVKRLIGEEL